MSYGDPMQGDPRTVALISRYQKDTFFYALTNSFYMALKAGAKISSEDCSDALEIARLKIAEDRFGEMQEGG